MFGFIIGTLCLIGLVATLRHHRHAYGHYGHFERGYGPPWQREWSRFRPSPRGYLRGLFVRLDTTPGQEKAIVAILEKARDRARSLKGELREVRKQVAALLGSDVLDKEALEARLAQPKGALEQLSAELVEMLAAIHEVLDDRQRRVLGELIADGSLGHGPYSRC